MKLDRVNFKKKKKKIIRDNIEMTSFRGWNS
jgi:hypothetical protein